MREVSFKIIHLVYPVNQELSRIRNDIDGKIVFCNNETETMCHLFYDCQCTKLFGLDIAYFFKTTTGSTMNLDKRDII